jgi:hypothetical protein
MESTQPICSINDILNNPYIEDIPEEPQSQATQPTIQFEWSQTPGYQPQSSQPAPALQYISQDDSQDTLELPNARFRSVLSEIEHREVIKYCVEHRDLYADRNYTRK